ncbi:FMN-binding glutamate synthase family protein [Laceyella putida]|uniref:FMN-binding glutamate synthase family protein n=1 Tax=Laceyella putida TaxID=110101 RepID=A0ABW2RJQ7_9BACL
MLTRIVHRIINSVADAVLNRMMQDPYTENLFSFVTIMQKLTLRSIVESAMRAESGKPLLRPLGSPVVLSRWEQLMFNPVHLFRMPTQDGVQVHTGVTIGPKAKKPLSLEIPILISGMSYGGALGLKTKRALARGATLAGTATNSGEAPLVPEERREARHFIGQYNRGGWMNNHESLSQLDAIEIQLGQGAQASAPMGTSSWQMDDEFRRRFHIPEGEDAPIHSRLKGINRPEEFPPLVRKLRQTYGVPVGLKTCATHYLEEEIDWALKGGIDYIVVDGAEAGTHGGPTILQDDVGLPTLFALSRAVRHLEKLGVKQEVSVIAAGGLTTPGHFLKAMALGADAVYIGSIALVAMLQTQFNIASPFEPPVQNVLYHGKFKEDINVEEGAEHLAKFLKSCVDEMRLTAIALGKTDLKQIDRSDLVCMDRELAQVLGVDYAGWPRAEQRVARQEERQTRQFKPDHLWKLDDFMSYRSGHDGEEPTRPLH